MYTPKHFQITDPKLIDRFIRNNAFGQLLSEHEGRIEVSHLPFWFDPDQQLLLAHVAKANPQHQSISGQEVLAIFNGPHGYVSPQWYEKSGVPTWNYQVAHVRGQASTFTDEAKLQNLVDRLSSVYEQNLPNPWQPDYPPAMLKAIVGIEIRITEIDCKFKLNQNHPEINQRNVIQHLKEQGNHALAQAMQDTPDQDQ